MDSPSAKRSIATTTPCQLWLSVITSHDALAIAKPPAMARIGRTFFMSAVAGTERKMIPSASTVSRSSKRAIFRTSVT